jgi:hypothetical protein
MIRAFIQRHIALMTMEYVTGLCDMESSMKELIAIKGQLGGAYQSIIAPKLAREVYRREYVNGCEKECGVNPN